MEIGLCRDLAVACPANGADGWYYGDVYVEAARLGAPPDAFNPAGQEWGIAPMHPHRLRDLQYRPFIDLLRANMRHAGALRIDHVMWIARQFWVPTGGSPADGTYIHFPFDDLLGILALESRRNQCMIIGEDLGTVPENFRERMADADIFSSRVLYFESEHGRFRTPAEYPRLAAASVTTHDLPTLKGFWSGADLKERHQLGLFPSPEIEQRSAESRHWDIANMARALREAGLLPDGPETPDWSEEVWHAVHAFLAQTNSALTLVQIDDLTDEEIQVNLPGTSDDQRANWRRRLSKSLKEIASDRVIEERLQVIATGRRPVRQPGSG
jgi:4-alpha-glucanotransferase